MVTPAGAAASTLLAGFLVAAVLQGTPAKRIQPDILKPVAALPAHIAGSFQDLTACHQAPGGEFLVFDRRAHSVYLVSPALDDVRKLVEIGTEPGRVLDPTAFDLAPDGSFLVADAPHGQPRLQLFMPSGYTLRGFFLPGRAVPRITLGRLVLNGIAALEYTGTSVLVSQPEHGGLITEYTADGRPLRTFGVLRRTGQEADKNLHYALNAGIVVANPRGGFYFVFLAGLPQFRKYGADGTLLFERHIEGKELDAFIQDLPGTWRAQKTTEGEIPLVLPSVFAAAADRQGQLWVSLAVGTTYVYDADGDKQRTVQFQAARPMAPTSMSFTPGGRLLVAPGCYAFQP